MAVTSVTSVASKQSTVTPKGASTAKSTLDMAAYIKLMVTQLQNQNPLEPVKDSEYYAQIAQLGTVQGIDTLTKSYQATEASSMLGKTVTASASDGSSGTITGQVVKLTNNSGTYELTVKDSAGVSTNVTIDKIQTVSS